MVVEAGTAWRVRRLTVAWIALFCGAALFGLKLPVSTEKVSAFSQESSSAERTSKASPEPSNSKEDIAAASVRAQELLKRARAAAGIETASSGIQTLSFKAKSQRFSKYVSVQSPTKVVEKEKTLSGKIEADCWLPDKFRLKTKGSTLTGFGFSYANFLNGDQAWRNPPMSVRSFGRDSRVIDVGDVERTLLMQERTAKQQITFYALGWLMQAPPSLQLKLSYAGVYELNGQTADVVVADGQDGFRILLFFDRKTHLLAALGTGFFDSYRETVIVEAASFDPRFNRATFMRAREERRLRTQPPKQHEVIWQFSDYRQVGGVTLPHRVAIKFDDRVVEELTINEFKVNQPANPKNFDGKPEVVYGKP
jgi:hypothetical protein